MPNIKSAKKRVLISEKKAARNKMLKTRLKTAVKKFNAAAQTNDKAAVTGVFAETVKEVDQAVAHGILHKNNAARKKSQLAKKLNSIG